MYKVGDVVLAHTREGSPYQLDVDLIRITLITQDGIDPIKGISLISPYTSGRNSIWWINTPDGINNVEDYIFVPPKLISILYGQKYE